MSSSSSSPPPPQLSLPHVTGSSYHDPEHKAHAKTRNDIDGNSDLHVSEEPLAVYESDTGEASARQRQRHRRRQGSLWARSLATVTPLFASSNKYKDKAADASLPLLPLHKRYSKIRPQWMRKPSRSCCLLYSVVGFLAMLGVIQFFTLACSLVISFFPDEIDRVTDRWRHPSSVDPTDLNRWPTDISRDIIPVHCHSHNDYWRRVPLYSALEAGCVGVEADVWLLNDDLFVGHTVSSLTPSRTLRSMYIDPLMRILRRQNPITDFHQSVDEPRNGVFDTDPSQSVILLIDFKTDGEETWNAVFEQLTPLREEGYLTYYNGSDIINGPITVVGTGNAPFNRIAASTSYRDIFFDAPLDRLVDTVDRIEPEKRLEGRNKNAGQGLSGIKNGTIEPDMFDETNSYYASVSFKKAVGTPWMLHLSERQVQTIRSQIQAAHRQGLKVRYWGAPHWPRSLRNHVWRVLAREGADMLNVDDLVSATRKDWAPIL